jgi:hypothetical protein
MWTGICGLLRNNGTVVAYLLRCYMYKRSRPAKQFMISNTSRADTCQLRPVS